MEIIKIESYLDGGTIEITTNRGSYCIDDRLFSKTKGSIFCNYPEDNNNNIVHSVSVTSGKLIPRLELTCCNSRFNFFQTFIFDIDCGNGFSKKQIVKSYDLI